MNRLLASSDGIRLCLEHGSCSGQVMDYVALNRAGGTSRIGRWLDRQFLRYPGWEAVRARRQVLVEVLVPRLADAGPLAILDLACGTGEILREALRLAAARDVEVTGVDLDADSISKAAASTPSGLKATYRQGDALAAGIGAGADLVVVSGFYELIGADAVSASLADLAATMSRGASLVMAHQISQPKPTGLAGLGARILPADPVYPRSKSEVLALVRAAGFSVELDREASERYVVVVAKAVGS